MLWYVRLTDVIALAGGNAYLLLLPSSADLAAIVVGTAIAHRQRIAGVALVAFGAAWTLFVIGSMYDDAALATTMRAGVYLGALLPLVAVLAAADAPRTDLGGPARRPGRPHRRGRRCPPHVRRRRDPVVGERGHRGGVPQRRRCRRQPLVGIRVLARDWTSQWRS